MSGPFKVTVIFDLTQPLVNIIIKTTQNELPKATDDDPASTEHREGFGTIAEPEKDLIPSKIPIHNHPPSMPLTDNLLRNTRNNYFFHLNDLDTTTYAWHTQLSCHYSYSTLQF